MARQETESHVRTSDIFRRTKVRKHRNKLSIINDILSLAKNGVLKTHIMYRANLSYDQLNGYLEFLLRNSLIERIESREDPSSHLYKVTAKGNLYLQRYQNLQQTMTMPSND